MDVISYFAEEFLYYGIILLIFCLGLLWLGKVFDHINDNDNA